MKERLAQSPLLAGLEPGAVEALAAVFVHRRAAAGEVLVREGEEGDTMFVLRSGRVRVEKRTPYADTYTVTFLDGESGGFFGELALLDREFRSATVVAETDCELLVVGREGFLAFGDRHPVAGLLLTRRIAHHLAERLRRTNRDMVTLFTALVQEIGERL
ncbi:MAG: cyclic nucleotide-binding domain-containing protein [Vicinamibacteria bacterium]|nr:cyclic nucleotide-binding domain-containing protein [Vicinamibacteria bacterium]